MSFDRALATRETLHGNDAYAAGDFGAAITAYEAALHAGADSVDVWFNLGNAYYRAGQHGRAALAFEKALRRDPGDPEALSNLELIRSQTAKSAVAGQPLPLIDRVGVRVDPDVAATSLLLCWTMACFFVVAWLRLKGQALLRTLSGIAVVLLVAGSVAAGFVTWTAHAVRQAGWSIVVADGEVREAPDPSARVSFPVPEALGVRATAKVGGFTKVILPGGLSGWLESSKVEPIDAR